MIDRDALFQEAQPIVGFLARRFARGLGGAIDVEDLVAVGNAALHEALLVFDPKLSKLSTFARRRIKWALLDHIRRTTHARSAAAQALVAAERFVDAELEAPAHDDGDPEAYAKRLASLNEGAAIALALPFLLAAPDPVETPEDRTAAAQLSARMWRAVAGLDDRERVLIERHYKDGEQFDDVAASLRISKSWASRLHQSALKKLQRALKKSI